jgi:hypothetical protein
MDADVPGGGGAVEGNDPLHDRDRQDAPHRVRAFGKVAILLAPAIWAVAHFLWQAPRLALWLGAVVLVWGLLSYLAPGPMGPVLRGWATITRPLGIVVTTILLAGVYFLVLTPLGLLRRLLSPDPLRLRTKRGGRETYWSVKDLPAADSPRWYRPF